MILKHCIARQILCWTTIVQSDMCRRDEDNKVFLCCYGTMLLSSATPQLEDIPDDPLIVNEALQSLKNVE